MQSRVQEQVKPSRREVSKALSRMDGKPFLIDTLVNGITFVDAFVDSGCLCFSAFQQDLVNSAKLPRIELEDPRIIKLAKDAPTESIDTITYADIDIDGRKERVFGYVIPGLAHPIILGNPWLESNAVQLDPGEHSLLFKREGLRVYKTGWLTSQAAPSEVQRRIAALDVQQVARRSFQVMSKRVERRAKKESSRKAQVFAVTVADISKALEVKKKTTDQEIRDTLPGQLQEFLPLFQDCDDQGKGLAPHRPGLDTEIKLKRDDQGHEEEVPLGPLYGMSREELLVLRKTLSDHLDKNWIRASASPGGAPVLFVQKPGGGLRFCVDYRGLNQITERDRYPLPLIRETLRSLSKARWLTKVDVRAAFHRLRIKAGDEWKTAFRTRFGSFEWLVTPFGLAGAPSAFQRYINSALGDQLYAICSAYMDDVLIYSDGSYEDHLGKVAQVLKRLSDAKLQLDIKKSQFAVKEVKYLGFVISAGEGIKVDSEKVEAIASWEAPTSVKGVRSFLGFANFYREFMPDFSEVAAPLTALTKKDVVFRWGPDEEQAFGLLKRRFMTAPILAMWDPDRPTVVEADSSGYAIGACLSQVDKLGTLRPVAYFSKRLAPAECNYDIHDKELLSIVRAVSEWRGELVGLKHPFLVLTDHKNLVPFMSSRRLIERQIRWANLLSQFNFKFQFRAGKKAARPDALSRRGQDMPTDEEDERIKNRFATLIKDEWTDESWHTCRSQREPSLEVPMAWLQICQLEAQPPARQIPSGRDIFEDPELQLLWDRGTAEDSEFHTAYQAVARKDRSFPTEVHAKVSIAECEIDLRGALLFRGKTWVPRWEPLQTGLVQRAHDSHVTGHPGREGTRAILGRSFFWPGASQMVRQFCRNCDVCGRAHVWRDRRRGLLRPLPVPERFHSELSIDFMTELPAQKKGDPRYLMVITDRLTKGVTLEAMETMEAEACAERFVQCHVRYHGFPKAMVSDRGSNWVSTFWGQVCKLTRVQRQLSTAFHPQTDGATERANQEVLAYLRAFISYAQFDWPQLLPGAMLAINNRDSGLGLSPFFLTHGYHVDPIAQVEPDATAPGKPQEKAQAFVARLTDATEFAQAAMASIQERMEESANRSRSAAVRYQVGDLVWLNLRNIQTPQLKKKLAWVHAKYRVTAVPSSHVVELDVPTGIWPRFHVDLVRPAATDPLPSQEVLDEQPPPLVKTEEGEPEYEVSEILRADRRRRGRGWERRVLVKWKGFQEPTWEPRREFEETAALSVFESRYGTADGVGVETRMLVQRDSTPF